MRHGLAVIFPMASHLLDVTDAAVADVSDVLDLIRMHGVNTLTLSGCESLVLQAAAATARVVTVPAQAARHLAGFLCVEMLTITGCCHLGPVPLPGVTSLTLRGLLTAIPVTLPAGLTRLSLHSDHPDFDAVPALVRCTALTHFTLECDGYAQINHAAAATAACRSLQHVVLIVHDGLSESTTDMLNAAFQPPVRLDLAANFVLGAVRAQLLCVRRIYGISTCAAATLRTSCTHSNVALPPGTRLELYCCTDTASLFEDAQLRQAAIVLPGHACNDPILLGPHLEIHYVELGPFTPLSSFMHVLGPHLRHLHIWTVVNDVPPPVFVAALADCVNLAAIHLPVAVLPALLPLILAAIPANIETVAFQTAYLQRSCADALIAHLPCWPALRSLSFQNCEGDARIAQALPRCTALRHLTLLDPCRPSNSLTVTALPSLPTLTRLDIGTFDTPHAVDRCIAHSDMHINCATTRALFIQPSLRTALWTQSAHNFVINRLVAAFLLGMHCVYPHCDGASLLQLLGQLPVYIPAGLQIETQ